MLRIRPSIKFFATISSAGNPYGPEQTLTLQPDGTDGLDVFLRSDDPAVNNGASANIFSGEDAVNPQKMRTLIKFDLSGIPTGSRIVSVSLSLFLLSNNASANARDHRVFRSKRAWVEAEATWNSYKAATSWQTAGGFGANDCEQTDIGSLNILSNQTINNFLTFALSAVAIQEMITGGAWSNNGFLIKADTEDSDKHQFASSDYATAGNRPKLVIVYQPPS